ncbi:acyltransferase [Collinsella tanakaei]|uniref:acyltransferase n=1 Tax=Collinsella tanakaei TaxID=626935 RepID=UPI0022E83122|nr:acyltransferase [Collinsella tanakaei]
MSSNNQAAVPGKTSRGGARNSSIELLRILSMFMIMLHHLVVHNVVDYKAMDPGIFRFLLQFLFVSGGKVGVVIFFAISAWFLADAATGVKASLRRVWMLEKEVLFYSVVFGVGCYLIMDGVGFGALLRGVFPLMSSIWWYTTAYAGFLIVFPFLTDGLRAMGRKRHLSLCAVLFFVIGVVGLLPVSPVVTGAMGMMYLFVLISAYKWYVAPEHAFDPLKLIAVGAMLLLPYVLASLAAKALLDVSTGAYITSETKTPILLMGFGIFLLFERMHFYSPVVNKVAACSLSVYLITEFPAIASRMWQGPFSLDAMAASPAGFAYAIVLCAAVYIACAAVDGTRRWLFSKGIDAAWSGFFEQSWGLLAIRGRIVLGKACELLR